MDIRQEEILHVLGDVIVAGGHGHVNDLPGSACGLVQIIVVPLFLEPLAGMKQGARPEPPDAVESLGVTSLGVLRPQKCPWSWDKDKEKGCYEGHHRTGATDKLHKFMSHEI